MSNFKKTKTYEDVSDSRVIQAHVKVEKIGKQEPYFSVTYSEYERDSPQAPAGEERITRRGQRYVMCSGGSSRERITKHFPHLKQAVRFHLCSSSGPMHYVDNSWFHMQRGDHGAAKRSMVWGILPSETDKKYNRLREMNKKDFREELRARWSLVRTVFVEEIGNHFTTDAEILLNK